MYKDMFAEKNSAGKWELWALSNNFTAILVGEYKTAQEARCEAHKHGFILE